MNEWANKLMNDQSMVKEMEMIPEFHFIVTIVID